MPISVVTPIVGGDVGIWGTKNNTALLALQGWANAEEATRVANEATYMTASQVAAAITAATAATLLNF